MQKINVRNMIIMGLIGMFIGIFISIFIMLGIAGGSQNTSGNFPLYATILISTLVLGFWGSRMKQTEKKEVFNKDGLTTREKTIAWISALANPLIAGGIMYYLWKETYPNKAKEANAISWIAILIWFLLYIFGDTIRLKIQGWL